MKAGILRLRGEYDTCVHAFPGAQALRDEDGDTIYRVSEFCPKARKDKDLVFLWDMGGCRKCPYYANRDRFFRIRSGHFSATIYADRLTAYPVKNLRLLFRTLLWADWEEENRKSIAYLTDLLTNGPLYHAETDSQLRRWEKVRDLWDEMRKKWGH